VARSDDDLPIHIDRLVRQIRRLDAEYAFLKERLPHLDDEATAELMQREMADLKNQRVTLLGDLDDWLGTLPSERRVLVEAFLAIGGRGHDV
jgi:hypothetical protein